MVDYSWSGKPDVLNFESGEMELIDGVYCDATTFAATHPHIADEIGWQRILDRYTFTDETGTQMINYNSIYQDYNLNHITSRDNFEALQQFHKEGYTKAHLRVTNYISETGENAPHRMAVKKIRFIPGKLFEVHVGDPGRSYIDAKYNLTGNSPFTFNIFSLFR